MPKRSFDLSVPKNGQTDSTLPIICERIRYYREIEGIDQKTMAKKLGITGNSISNWENGRSRPDVNLLPSVCKVLNISLYDLFDLENPFTNITKKQQELINKYNILSKGHQFIVDNLLDNLLSVEKSESCPDLKLLLYFNRSLAAGIGDPTEFEDDAEPVYVYSTPEVNHADSIFKVNGDSMEPAFSDGQDVLVQRLKGSLTMSFGEIGAFIVGNETYIKKYEKDGLHSLNPNYPVMHFDEDESVFLIGRVIGAFDPSGYANQEDIERFKLLHN